jgi:hypothetical protein
LLSAVGGPAGLWISERRLPIFIEKVAGLLIKYFGLTIYYAIITALSIPFGPTPRGKGWAICPIQNEAFVAGQARAVV